MSFSTLDDAWDNKNDPIHTMMNKYKNNSPLDNRESIDKLQMKSLDLQDLQEKQSEEKQKINISDVDIKTSDKHSNPLTDKSKSSATFNPFTENEKYDHYFSPHATITSDTMISTDLQNKNKNKNGKSILKSKKNKKNNEKNELVISDTIDDFSDFDISSSSVDNGCKFTNKHIKKCKKCNHKLKRIINNRLNEKYDDMVFDYHRKNSNKKSSKSSDDNLKQTIIIIIGIIICLVILFLIIKQLTKSN